MREKLDLQLNQRQIQTLTPLQMQFVKVLEMTAPEIEEHVREVVEENPALEVGEEPGCNDGYGETSEELQRADYRNEEEIPDGVRQERGGGAMYETAANSRGETLQEAVMRQLRELGAGEDELLVGEYVAGNLDGNGYMTRDALEIADDIAISAGRYVDEELVEEVMGKVRGMEPAGIGARDLRDCIRLQLERIDAEIPGVGTARRIADEGFDTFSKMHFDKLRVLLGVEEEELQRAVGVIKSLNPKPGALLGGHSVAEERAGQITPDFLVESDADGKNLSVSVPNALPRLEVERTFATDELAKGANDNGATAMFIKQKRDEASNFIKTLEMRQNTLLNVMGAIVKLQREFFMTEDVRKLRPMVLKDVAALTDLDLSVISRATSGKYVATNRGIYPLKMFFSERPTEGSDASAHEIMDAIRGMIEGEDKRKPLSDSAITEGLEGKGYGIARRTVAKYRERMGFPVARLRREI